MSLQLSRLRSRQLELRKVYDRSVLKEENSYLTFTFIQGYYNDWKRANEKLVRFKNQCQVIGFICVQQQLPGGNPCWMAEKIASYM
jgi:hypothetical protein